MKEIGKDKCRVCFRAGHETDCSGNCHGKLVEVVWLLKYKEV